MVEVMTQVGCRSTHMDTTLGHHIQGWVGASSVEQWYADGHGDAWGSVIVCWTTLWSGSASHHIEYMWGVTGVVTLVGHRMVQDCIVIAGGIQWCIGTGLWHTVACQGVQ